MESAMRRDIDILLVEDNDFDVEAVRRAFRRAEIPNVLHSATDGVDALNALRGSDGKPPLPQPLMILLDINMPRMDGFEFLNALRNDKKLENSVVFMLTTSSHNKDRERAYSSHVSGYFLKENLGDLVATLKSYLQGNEFPQSAV